MSAGHAAVLPGVVRHVLYDLELGGMFVGSPSGLMSTDL